MIHRDTVLISESALAFKLINDDFMVCNQISFSLQQQKFLDIRETCVWVLCLTCLGGDSCATGLPNGTLHNTGQMCSFFKGHVTLNETVRLSETRGSVQTAAGPGFIGVLCFCVFVFFDKTSH